MAVTSQTSSVATSKGRNQTSQIKQKDTLGKRVRGIMGGLALEFLLGLSLATFANDSPAHKTLHDVVLGLHVLIGFGLIIGATFILVIARRQASGGVRTLASVGFAAIVAAFAFGVLTINVRPHDLFSFLMGTMFLIAFATYGVLAGRLTFGPRREQ